MLKKVRNSGVLALILTAGMALAQPGSAMAADRHDGNALRRDAYHDQLRRGDERRVMRDDRDRNRTLIIDRDYTPPPVQVYRNNVYRYDRYPYSGHAICPR